MSSVPQSESDYSHIPALDDDASNLAELLALPEIAQAIADAKKRKSPATIAVQMAAKALLREKGLTPAGLPDPDRLKAPLRLIGNDSEKSPPEDSQGIPSRLKASERFFHDLKPRQDVEAEGEVLAASIRSPSLRDSIFSKLDPRAFHNARFRAIFQGALECHQSGNFDVNLLVSHLGRVGHLDRAGGESLVRSVAKRGYVEELLPKKIDNLLDHALCRDLLDLGAEALVESANSKLDGDQLLSKLKSSIYALEERRSGSRWETPEFNPSVAAPFPLEVFPEPLRLFIQESARCLPSPIDYLAVPCLSVAGTAIGRSMAIEVWEDWTEEGNVWTLIVGEPGSAKTHALNAVVRPLREINKERVKVYEGRKRTHEAIVEAARGQAGVGRSHQAFSEPFPRIIVKNTTLEALANRLVNNPRGLLMHSDELSGWLNSMNQYKSGGKGNDRQHYIELRNRNGITIDRVSQENGIPLICETPFFALAGGIQPDKISSFSSTGPSGKREDDGFNDRFFYSFPEPVEIKFPDRSPSKGVRKSWSDAVRKLWNVPLAKDEKTKEEGPTFVSCTPEAFARFKAYYNGNSAETRKPDFPKALKGHYAKLRYYVMQLALILHMLEWAFSKEEKGTSEIPKKVTLKTIEGAIKLAEYFALHYQRVLQHTSGSGNETNDDAQAILEWAIKRQGAGRRFSLKDAKSNFRRRFESSPQDLIVAIKWLETRQFIKNVTPRDGRHNGRNPSAIFEINPEYLSERAPKMPKIPGLL